MIFLISSRIYSAPKISKYVKLSPFTYKAIQWVPIDLSHQDLLHISHPLIQVFFYQNESKEWGLKILTYSNHSFISSLSSIATSHYSLITPSLALSTASTPFVTTLPTFILPNKLTPNVPNKISINPLFCYFA